MMKRILLPSLVAIFTITTFGCQTESTQESTPTDTPAEDNLTEEGSTNQQNVEIAEITHITWMWSELHENEPATLSVVPDPENYTITFWDDSSFSFKADCNDGSGTYMVQDNKIEFGPMMSTMAMCLPESLHDQYLALLGEIDTFGMVKNELVFILKADAGEMRFTNGGPAKQPDLPKEDAEIPAPEEKIIFVGPEKVDCTGVGPQECFLLKEERTGEWQMIYDQIHGFDWEPGYTYQLRVAIYQVENPPADASSLRYELVEMIDKVETPFESEQSRIYIQIKQPGDGAALDTSKPILVSGMGAGLFEGNVVVQIFDAAGNELAMQPTTIQSPDAGTGGEGSWKTEISLVIDAPTDVKIVAFSPSPKDGEGWVASDEVSVRLNPGKTPDASLEETPWILRSLAQQEDLNSALSVVQVTALFSAQSGRLSGIAGCNSYFTSYTLDGNQMSLSTPIGTTQMLCPEPQMVVENAYLAGLEEIDSYEMTCNAMEILDADGNSLLIFGVDPFSLSESFSREELANTSYLNGFAKSGVVQLVDGLYREPTAEVSATELVVMLTNHAVFGDVTGDQTEEAVVVLVSQPGGSGSFYDLAVVRKQGDAMTNMAVIQLGDRVQIKSLHIEDGEIAVDMLKQRPDDPMCCPTQYISQRYLLESGELVLTQTDVIE